MCELAGSLNWSRTVTMCRMTGNDGKCSHGEDCEMGFKFLSEVKAEKSKNSWVLRPRMKLFVIRILTIMLICASVAQLMTLGEIWGPRIFKGWPSCFSPSGLPLPGQLPSAPYKVVSPQKSKFWAWQYNLSCLLYFYNLDKEKSFDCHRIKVLICY